MACRESDTQLDGGESRETGLERYGKPLDYLFFINSRKSISRFNSGEELDLRHSAQSTRAQIRVTFRAVPGSRFPTPGWKLRDKEKGLQTETNKQEERERK